MSTAVQDLLDILDLEPLEVNLFRGRSPQAGWQRVFGGQVIGQALVAAVRTVDAAARRIRCTPISCCPAIPRCRSSTTSTASATARASPRAASPRASTAIRSFPCWCRFTCTRRASTTRPRCRTCRRRRSCRAKPRCARRCCRRCPTRCGAITSASGRSNCARSSSTATSARNIPTAASNVWIRATGQLPDDPAIHQCVLAYASDMTLLDTALVPHGRTLFEKEFMAASLDHALWLHRPFRADEWLLYAQDRPTCTARAASRAA